MSDIDFTKPVVMAADLEPCECCGEPWCAVCQDHYADCSCPGPHSEPLARCEFGGDHYQEDCTCEIESSKDETKAAAT